MRCDEVQTLHGPYLDSELDVKTSLEVEQHLKGCPNCARLLNEEQKLEVRIKAGLNQGGRTAALWEQIEGAVAGGAAPGSARAQSSLHVSQPTGARGLFAALSERFQNGWRRSRWAWSGLAAVWLAILALNSATRGPEGPVLARQEMPSASEMRLAWKQKQQLLGDLSFVPESTPADKSKAAPPSPRSDRREPTLNT